MRISYWSSDVCSSDLFVLDCGPAGDGAAHRKALDLRRQPLRRRGETGGHDEHLRTRIAPDIVGLVLRQPRRNADIAQPGALRAPRQSVIMRPVVEHEGDDILMLQSMRPEPLPGAVRSEVRRVGKGGVRTG